jgi:hypothetical protein
VNSRYGNNSRYSRQAAPSRYRSSGTADKESQLVLVARLDTILGNLASGIIAFDAAPMKTSRTWSPEDKAFLKRLSKMTSRLVEEIEAPMMQYYGRMKVGRKLSSWRNSMTVVAKSIEREIERLDK